MVALVQLPEGLVVVQPVHVVGRMLHQRRALMGDRWHHRGDESSEEPERYQSNKQYGDRPAQASPNEPPHRWVKPHCDESRDEEEHQHLSRDQHRLDQQSGNSNAQRGSEGDDERVLAGDPLPGLAEWVRGIDLRLDATHAAVEDGVFRWCDQLDRLGRFLRGLLRIPGCLGSLLRCGFDVGFASHERPVRARSARRPRSSDARTRSMLPGSRAAAARPRV